MVGDPNPWLFAIVISFTNRTISIMQGMTRIINLVIGAPPKPGPIPGPSFPIVEVFWFASIIVPLLAVLLEWIRKRGK